LDTLLSQNSVTNNPRQDTLERARELVLKYGWNATSYQIINPGILHWFSRSGDAVIGYVNAGRVRVVAGAPVCQLDELSSVCDEFEAEAKKRKQTVCYFGGEARLDNLFAERKDHSFVVLGAQPAWTPKTWGKIIASHASLRAQLNRARNKEVYVEEWSSERATDNPQLKQCLEEWLSTRGLPPLHFLVEPSTLSRLIDRRVFVALQQEIPVAFLVASPVPLRHGWLIEQIIRGHKAPNGTNELLIDHAMGVFAEAQSDYVTLGLSPLSQHSGIPITANPEWLRLLLQWVRAHGNRFYNFKGLDAFKSKFRPHHWEPVFAISSERKFSILSLYAIAAAFTKGHPIKTVLKGFLQAAAQEIKWFDGYIDRKIFRRELKESNS